VTAPALDPLVEFIRSTRLSEVFRNEVAWLWPLCESLHFLGLSLLIGTAGFFDLRLLGFMKGVPLRSAKRIRLVPRTVVRKLVLDPSTKRLTGQGRVRYQNRSPDTLRNLPVHLHQNLFAPGVARNVVVPPTTGMDLTRVVAGLPLEMSGHEGNQARRVRAFCDALAARTGLEIAYQDERMTTRESERILVESGVRRAKRRKVIDKMAAVLILQAYLDAHGSR